MHANGKYQILSTQRFCNISEPPCAQALAEAAGEGTAQHAAEVSALADEADMPLDQLLAQYGYVIGEDGRKRSADDAHGVDDDGSPSDGKPLRLANVSSRYLFPHLRVLNSGAAKGSA